MTLRIERIGLKCKTVVCFALAGAIVLPAAGDMSFFNTTFLGEQHFGNDGTRLKSRAELAERYAHFMQYRFRLFMSHHNPSLIFSPSLLSVSTRKHQRVLPKPAATPRISSQAVGLLAHTSRGTPRGKHGGIVAAIDNGRDASARSSPMRQWQSSGISTNACGRGQFLAEPDLDLDVSVKRFQSNGEFRTKLGNAWIRSSSGTKGLPVAWKSDMTSDPLRSATSHLWWRQMETNSRVTVQNRR